MAALGRQNNAEVGSPRPGSISRARARRGPWAEEVCRRLGSTGRGRFVWASVPLRRRAKVRPEYSLARWRARAAAPAQTRVGSSRHRRHPGRRKGGYPPFPPQSALMPLNLHHLAPLLGFLGDQLAEVSGRTRKHRAAEVSEPRFHVGIGEASVDLLV